MSKNFLKVKICVQRNVDWHIDPRVRRVLKAANDLTDRQSDRVGYLHTIMCQTCLPLKKPPPHIRAWKSSNGDSIMLLEAGVAFDQKSGEWQKLPLPYGTRARLALIHLNKRSAVPLDLKAVAALGHSALAMDIYFWLAQRLWRLTLPYTVYWTELHKQFGSGYSRLCDFRRKFRKALRYATAVYPTAIVEDKISENGTSRGIRLYPSPPPILKKRRVIHV